MLTTFQQHIVQEQTRRPGSPVELQWLMSGVILAAKLIQAQVRRAGLIDHLGAINEINPQGEVQQKLDVYANEIMIKSFSLRESVGVIASEENEHPIAVHHNSPDAQYAIIFDPLDGSSNIDVAVTIGTTFSILRRPDKGDSRESLNWVLQPGRRQVAAGYVLYGSSTMLVYSMGNGVHGFTFDPSIGSFILSHENLKMPEQGSYYSINEAYNELFPSKYVEFINRIKRGELGKFYSSRFVGSMVADFHRTLLRGGIFIYPETPNYPNGRLRLLYEANPIAYIAEQAGGMASNSVQPILDVHPTALHQRTPLVIGGKTEMEAFMNWTQD
ncbi:MAG TPA: class 1 fructose-bisphosphatase [Pyrinomonadaceae bacterium]|nr:class 1 fructose-bisphosphatase [Pyrinomonadaceae bacterium]